MKTIYFIIIFLFYNTVLGFAQSLDNKPDAIFVLLPPFVYQYVHDFDYDDNYDYSLVTEYIEKNDANYERMDCPLPVYVDSLFPNLDQQEVFFRVSLINIHGFENETVKPVIIYNENGYQLFNLIPGRNYELSVYNSNTKELLGTEIFHTTGQVRMLNAGIIRNVRDIGGWRTEDGGRVKYGRVIRGGV